MGLAVGTTRDRETELQLHVTSQHSDSFTSCSPSRTLLLSLHLTGASSLHLLYHTNVTTMHLSVCLFPRPPYALAFKLINHQRHGHEPPHLRPGRRGTTGTATGPPNPLAVVITRGPPAVGRFAQRVAGHLVQCRSRRIPKRTRQCWAAREKAAQQAGAKSRQRCR